MQYAMLHSGVLWHNIVYHTMEHNIIKCIRYYQMIYDIITQWGPSRPQAWPEAPPLRQPNNNNNNNNNNNKYNDNNNNKKKKKNNNNNNNNNNNYHHHKHNDSIITINNSNNCYCYYIMI